MIRKIPTKKFSFQRKFNAARAEVYKWERILSKVKESIIDHERETATLSSAILHIYQLLAKRRGRRDVEEKSTVALDASAQLDFVANEMEILTEIVRRAKKLQQSSAGSGGVDDASRKNT